MISSNWDIFRAKFTGRDQQDKFEWFCYLLFCKEFNQTLGIFRYKDQTGIETNPVVKGNAIIGFQAKFYSSTLSEHKSELIKAIEKSKKRYSDITKLIFYTNEEWGQGKKDNDSQDKKDIESKALQHNIEIEWRCASYFESPFVSIENEVIAKYFFSFEKSIIDFIEIQTRHTENILNAIQTHIYFNEKVIEIQRDTVVSQLKNSFDNVLILSGSGGTGKTAIIKNLYEQLKETCAIYIFKATEFELRTINELIPKCVFQDFVNAHKEISKKTIIIDSAESLLNLKNTEPFKEFLAILTKNNWKIIFTTRDNYLENINSDFFEMYKIQPSNFRIENLTQSELQQLAETNSFVLPSDEKILNLIRNPFYLNKYLKFYKPNEQVGLVEFKEKLWTEIIRHNNPAREQCFLDIALKRANEGQFFIASNFDKETLAELKKDEILGYDNACYFITHDIYEEWALEKIIETEFNKKADNANFFERIGQSLPVRRSFRKWLSDKLLSEIEQVKPFIEDVIDDKSIASFWQDEILVSVLLSDYVENFFEIFDRELLKNDFVLLIKMSFLLRIACKEVDAEILKTLAISNPNLFFLEMALTRPKGKGWKSLIRYVFQNIEKIGYKNIRFFLPVIHDWNNKFKDGETTRLSSLIALKYYQWIIQENIYISRDESKKQILQTVLYGSSEIKTELVEVFDNVVKNNWKQHRDPYQDLSKMILTTWDGIFVVNTLPQSVLQLADLFWTASPKETNYFGYSREVESDFGLVGDHDLKYFPSSAYQTPIYSLLNFSFQETIDFILAFTNKVVKFYSKHPKYEDVKEVAVFISDNVTVTQYHSTSLWCIYRGTSSPVAPYLLQSIHMALEKFFLEKFKNVKQEIMESLLIYLLKNSKSSSISAVVTSIVLAYPDKTFNIATILFKTKEFISSDFNRAIQDSNGSPKSLYSIGYGLNHLNQIFQDERIKTCNDKHRNSHLENLFFQYLSFKNEETSEQEAKNRQTILWQILDDYYDELSENEEDDKSWRFHLARMDRRKMEVTKKPTDTGIEINFKSKLDPELEEYSEKSQQRISEDCKYVSLRLWADYKLQNNEAHKKYLQYENNQKFAVEQVREIFLDEYQLENLFNRGVPESVCAVLIRDFFDVLSDEDAIFCKDVLLKNAVLFLNENYQYQVGNGIEPTISVLSILLQKFPDEKIKIKKILLFSLFNKYFINEFSNFNASPIIEVEKLWQSHFDDAQSILFGYLLLHKKYVNLIKTIQQEKYKKGIYIINKKDITERLYQENKDIFEKFIDNKFSFNEIFINELDLNTLTTAFKLIDNKTQKVDHKFLVKKIIEILSNRLFSEEHDSKINYELRYGFTQKLSYFILTCEFQEIQEYLQPILENFNNLEEITDLFREIIYAEDALNSYENFWEVWYLFQPKIIELSKIDNWHTDKVLKSYLFAQCDWKETAIEWHTFKIRDKRFFKEMAIETGRHPSVLYAIAKLLNGIGSCYLDDGIVWMSSMLKNKELLEAKAKQENNTIYYLEHISKKYIYKKREEIRRTKQLKDDVLVILNFLIDNGSVVGYMLRENIL